MLPQVVSYQTIIVWREVLSSADSGNWSICHCLIFPHQTIHGVIYFREEITLPNWPFTVLTPCKFLSISMNHQVWLCSISHPTNCPNLHLRMSQLLLTPPQTMKPKHITHVVKMCLYECINTSLFGLFPYNILYWGCPGFWNEVACQAADVSCYKTSDSHLVLACSETVGREKQQQVAENWSLPYIDTDIWSISIPISLQL